MTAQSSPKALLDFWAELGVTNYQEPFEVSRKKGDAMLDLVKSVIGDAWLTSVVLDRLVRWTGGEAKQEKVISAHDCQPKPQKG